MRNGEEAQRKEKIKPNLTLALFTAPLPILVFVFVAFGS